MKRWGLVIIFLNFGVDIFFFNSLELKEMSQPIAHTSKKRPAEFLYGPDGHAEKTERILKTFHPFVESVVPQDSLLLPILGRYHDMGKASEEFQRYLQGKRGSADHKTAAARWWRKDDKDRIGTILGYAFLGHHSGLPNYGKAFTDAFAQANIDEAVEALPSKWKEKPALASYFPNLKGLVTDNSEVFFLLSMLTRMLHSSLVDADWLATEEFMNPQVAEERRRLRDGRDSIEILSQKLEAHLASMEAQAEKKEINSLRKEIHEACFLAASESPGIFQLSVPTGGGKTLSSLSFALGHARRHGLDRVIYVIPYTSIIEQTAQEFRKVLGNINVVEHQSNIADGCDTRENRYAVENWDAPLIVTTNVQFFETLFACKNKRCRKLHNIAKSVIIFDEAQALPINYLHPCLASMKVLQKLCGCSLVLCTATQPNLVNREGFQIGWQEEELRSLIGRDLEAKLVRKMKRVELHDLGVLNEARLIEHLGENKIQSALMIVNTTKQAQNLYRLLRESGREGVYHLSARMCPAHRTVVLQKVCERLKGHLPTVLVSTRVVEAGVDISFPVVYRDRCGLDSLAQSAGRCNRHGEGKCGMVYSYAAEELNDDKLGYLTDLKQGIYARETVQKKCSPDDLLSPEIIDAYFDEFYYKRKDGSKNWDNKGIMEKLVKSIAWDFSDIDKKFKLIEKGQISLMVPYGEKAEALRNKIIETAKFGGLTREDYHAIQKYSVSVYEENWKELQSCCECLWKDGEIWMLTDPSLYDEECGLLSECSPWNTVC